MLLPERKKSQKMYKFSSAGKAIARGDDMKRPNKLLNKKYISSLVIAAFLILSVLTAYNIQFGNNRQEKKDTDVTETIGNNDDVISSGEARVENGEEGRLDDNSDSRTGIGGDNTGADTGESRPADEEAENGGNDQSQGGGDRDNEDRDDEENVSDTSEEDGQEADLSHFSYDGSSKMPWPVMGNVILPYSMDTTVYYTTLDQYACNDGILIGAKKGEDVIATADGRIVNIAKSDRYGTTVTMVIGEYYEVSYSQVENVHYEIGDEVKEGDVIATVAEPTRSFTLEGPHLFFKMTYKGETVNPTDYLEA